MSVVSDLVDSFREAPGLFADVATHDPISAILVAMGGLIIAASVGAFGILVLGAVVDLLTPGSKGINHP